VADQTLDQKKEQLAQTQKQIDDLTKQGAALKNEIQALETGGAEIKTAVAAYETAFKTLSADRQTLTDFVNDTQADIEPAIKDKKAQIDKKIEDFDKALAQEKADTEKAESDAKKLAADSADADRKADEKQKAFNQSKNAKASADAGLKELRELKQKIGDAAEEADFVSMYVLLREADAVAETTKVPEPDQLETDLQAELAEVGKSKSDASVKKQAAADAKTAAEKKRKDFDARSKRRREDLLKAVKA
jgi:colicin import membrane protein